MFVSTADRRLISATAHMVTVRIDTVTKMSDAVLNSGMVGLGDSDEVEDTVGVGEVISFDVLITETELPSKFVT